MNGIEINQSSEWCRMYWFISRGRQI